MIESFLDGSPEDVRIAANALAEIGDPAAGPALSSCLEGSGDLLPDSVAAVQRALVTLGLAERPPASRPSIVPVESLPTRSDYLAIVTPGLEAVAWEEITGLMPSARLKDMNAGSVLFTWNGSPQAGAILRSVRQLFQGGEGHTPIPLARRLRRYRVSTLPASLDPTTAYAMARLANMGERDVFVDLACGSATIALERSLDGPARLILAGDIDPEALKAARQNIEAGAQPVFLLKWDAVNLPLADHSIDAISANLPFGRRSSDHASNLKMYPAVLSEVSRVLRPDGIAVLLTAEKRLMRSCLLSQPHLLLLSERAIETGGLQPAVFVIQKESAATVK
jgi:ubiquinone/menaquinone biosynthesis C-methylase UbiE